jgi:hypothetical protein
MFSGTSLPPVEAALLRSIRIVSTTVLTLAVATPARSNAQQIDSVFKGAVLARLAAHRDSTFHYAAYIPRRYTGEHRVPLLIVLDPLGRAEYATQLVALTAERLGWVVMSSYDTRADVADAPNQRAVNLMLGDALASFHIDTARIYLAGLSGTAHDSWVFAYESEGHVAGIVSANASMPADTAWRRQYGGTPPFDVAMSAGDRGFNFDEVLNTADTLRALGAPVRADLFTGGQEWPPPVVLAQGMGWLEARAMARGLRPVDSLLVDSLYAVDSARAVAAADSGRTGESTDRWDNMAAAWQGMHDVAFARARLAALAALPAVRSWRAEQDSLRQITPATQRQLADVLSALRQRPGVPDLRLLVSDLKIVQFQELAADSTDSLRAAWAHRQLADLYAQVSQIEPEAYLRVGEVARALAVLSAAEIIRPRTAAVCRQRARAYALRGDAESTLDELRCALEGKVITVDEILHDPRYRFVRSLDAFSALIEKFGG